VNKEEFEFDTECKRSAFEWCLIKYRAGIKHIGEENMQDMCNKMIDEYFMQEIELDEFRKQPVKMKEIFCLIYQLKEAENKLNVEKEDSMVVEEEEEPIF